MVTVAPNLIGTITFPVPAVTTFASPLGTFFPDAPRIRGNKFRCYLASFDVLVIGPFTAMATLVVKFGSQIQTQRHSRK